jgi:hypothetical protein
LVQRRQPQKVPFILTHPTIPVKRDPGAAMDGAQRSFQNVPLETELALGLTERLC